MTPEELDRAIALTRLLTKFGWRERIGMPDRYNVWALPDEDADIVFPSNLDRPDAVVMVERARREVTRLYGHEAEKNLRLLELSQAARLDETEWRKESPFEGLIGWEDGEHLYAAARAQLVASAKSAREPRRYHGKAGAYLARNFLAKTLMGQTDVGSFIITAYTPSAERFHLSKASKKIADSQPRKAETIAGTAVLDTFETALSAVRSGLDEYRRAPRVDPFLEGVQEGVSLELITALELFIGGGDASVRVSRRPVEGRVAPSREYAFEGHEAAALSRVRTELAQDVAPRSVTVEGEVTDLSRKVKGGTRDRVIRVDARGANGVRMVRVRLDANQYEVAMTAHRHDNWIRVTGRVDRERNLNWMYHPDAIVEVDAPSGDEKDDPLAFSDMDFADEE